MLDKFDLLVADYVDTGKIKYVVHPFYLGRPEMGLAAEAAWCAQDQGDYFGYQHALYENQGEIDYSTNSLADLGESGADEGAERRHSVIAPPNQNSGANDSTHILDGILPEMAGPLQARHVGSLAGEASSARLPVQLEPAPAVQP